MSEIDLLIDGYWRWLRDKTAIKQLKDWTEITTPYLDRHNDYLQIYARKTDKGFVLTDGGETLLDLEQSGCLMDSPKRQAILQTILNGFGVEQQATELQVNATSDNFALRKHNLIQAILSVHDMFFLASSTIEALFFEDVATWLETVDIRYTPRVKFSGKSGFDHMFDFVIKSRLGADHPRNQQSEPQHGPKPDHGVDRHERQPSGKFRTIRLPQRQRKDHRGQCDRRASKLWDHARCLEPARSVPRAACSIGRPSPCQRTGIRGSRRFPPIGGTRRCFNRRSRRLNENLPTRMTPASMRLRASWNAPADC